MRLLPTVLGVSALGRCVRRTRCAVAATATVSLARAPLVRPALSSVATGSVRAAAQKTAVAVRPARAAPAHVQQTHTPFLPTAPVQDGVLVALAAPPAFATTRMRDLSAPAAEGLAIASA